MSASNTNLPTGLEPPPRGTRVMAIVRWVILGAMATLAVFAWASLARGGSRETESTAPAKHTRYRCPMHPQIVSDEPGECPICHMTLEPFEEGPSDAGTPDSTPRGTAPIQLSLERVQAIGVRTAVATSRAVKRATRVNAVIEAPEQGASEVHVRTPGFIESIAVNQTGIAVKGGQPLFSFYAPAIFEAEQELLTTKRWSDAGDPLTSATRTKLALLGVQSSDIDDIERTHAPKRAITVVAPKGGYVVKKNVTLGSYVAPDAVLYAIQDLSRVFVIANVFESDRDGIGVGTVGTFRSNRAPDQAREGRVDLVYPSVSPDARTTRVRIQLENSDASLSPGDFGVVDFAAKARTMTMIPRDAVVNTGTQTYVFIDDGTAHYTPRLVVLGEEDGAEVAISSGVEPGERVVSGATFLIDSESRLQASVSTGGGASPSASACDADFDKAKYPDKWAECQKCEQVHAGMGSMVTDCKNAIPKPWR